MSAPKFIDNQWDAGEDNSPHGGRQEGVGLRPFVGRTLMPSISDKAFKGEL
jgi:hypothetical protein